MKVDLELYAPDLDKYNKNLLSDIAQITLEKSSKINRYVKRVSLSVAIVSEDEIQRVNKQLRNKNIVTDVLSVGEYSDNRDIKKESEIEIFLGEVILCYNYIEQFAHENNCDIDKEFFTIYAHGILHLLGFSHSPEMFDIQDNVVANYIKK